MIGNQTVNAAEKSGPHILIVEDNVINQQVTVKILDQYGCKTHVVTNGREAVDALCRNTFDAVLMDLQMPVMDGFEATKAIRDPSGGCLNPRVPIIALTANSQEETRKKCLNEGMDDFLTKPVSPDLLMCTIRKCVEKFGEKRPCCDLEKYASKAKSLVPEPSNSGHSRRRPFCLRRRSGCPPWG
ncbi:MAG: response regulator [Desulfobacteraceae bacterium]